MEDHNFIKERIQTLKSEVPAYRQLQDYHVFTILCLKYFFFSDGAMFDPDAALEFLTDGANDGGIDAIFNDPNSEGNDMVIVQSKYYESTPLTGQDVAGELYKITQTIKSIDNFKVSNLNEHVVSAYRNAKSQMEETGEIRVVFFTSYDPKNKRERTKLEKINTEIFKSYSLEMNFRADIEAQIETIDNGKLCVDYDKLELDRKDNYLRYEDSVIVNISAQSLQNLQNRRRNGLLGMNLRYYVRQKTVDDGIQQTITREPENFWYKNNGIIIVCEDFQIDGKVLKLYNFSIVNGGQTTNRIGRLDIEQDFFLQCKVVKAKGTTANDRDEFTHNIAEASNSQKPIKKSDLKSNTPEQLRLRERLHQYQVYYITKKGDRAPKQYAEPYQSTTLEKVGKLGLAAVLQMPGSARSNSQRMYQDEYYYSIFGQNAKAGVIADALKISYYYDLFVKTSIKNKGYDEKTTLPMMKNGKTFQIACIAFLCKICYGVFAYDTVAGLLNNTDEVKLILKQMGNMERLISASVPDEQETFFEIFDAIGDEVLAYCFSNALDAAETEQNTLMPSNYLKLDTNYYKDIIKRLWRIYNKNEALKDGIQAICGVE